MPSVQEASDSGQSVRWQVDAETLEARYEKIRAFLEDQRLGALLVYSPPAQHQWGQVGHVGYLTGWANLDRVVDSAVVVPVEGPSALLFAGLPFMLDGIADVSPLEDVRLVQAVDPNAVAVASPKGAAAGAGPRSFAAETLAVLHEREIFQKDVGVVGLENMPLPFYEGLSTELGQNLRRVHDIVAELRSVKSSEEIDLMRHAAHLGDLGYKAMLEVAEPGMRGIEIVAEMERAARSGGADHAKYWMASGPSTTWEHTRLDMKPHERVLEEGDLMAVCSYIVYRGYWSHGPRTGTLRRPSEYLEKFARIAREALDAGISAIRPGVPAGAIAKAVREKAAESGWGIQGGRVGHGTGLDYSEPPIPSESNDTLLEVGHTIVLHPAYALPGSGKLFVPLGDQLHVTPTGPEFLMQFPRTPFLAGR